MKGIIQSARSLVAGLYMTVASAFYRPKVELAKFGQSIDTSFDPESDGCVDNVEPLREETGHSQYPSKPTFTVYEIGPSVYDQSEMLEKMLREYDGTKSEGDVNSILNVLCQDDLDYEPPRSGPAA